MVETESDEILRGADQENVALLVVGDPFGCVIYRFIFQIFSALAGPPRIRISFYELALSKSPFE
jgi:diphthine synthase